MEGKLMERQTGLKEINQQRKKIFNTLPCESSKISDSLNVAAKKKVYRENQFLSQNNDAFFLVFLRLQFFQEFPHYYALQHDVKEVSGFLMSARSYLVNSKVPKLVDMT